MVAVTLAVKAWPVPVETLDCTGGAGLGFT
ncbi:hypothetical protein YIM_26685 [Amycolatopsis sp. YIM 10]|nr:hypothetical protein YIM_26685 [Amycolatopsis sp. YIM 10]